MRKTLCIVTALVICLTLAISVAAESFVPSITAKPAPEVVKGNDAKTPAIEVVNEKDVQVETFDVNHVVIIPVANKDEAHVDDEVQAALTEAYETLSAPNVKLDKVMPELVNVIEEAAKEDPSLKNVKANDLVVKDLFSVSVSEELAKVVETEGNALKLTFDAKIEKGQFVVVMVCVDGKWVPVDFVINADGTITCTMEVVGVVAILTKA